MTKCSQVATVAFVVTFARIKLTPTLLANSNLRTLDTILSDHKDFIASGGDHKVPQCYIQAFYHSIRYNPDTFV